MYVCCWFGRPSLVLGLLIEVVTAAACLCVGACFAERRETEKPSKQIEILKHEQILHVTARLGVGCCLTNNCSWQDWQEG